MIYSILTLCRSSKLYQSRLKYWPFISLFEFYFAKLFDSNDTLKMDNIELKLNNKELKDSIENLKSVSDDLRKEMSNFKNVRQNFSVYAGFQGQNARLDKLCNQLNDSYRKLNSLLCENERILLLNMAHDMEFFDSNNHGMSSLQFQRFIARIPIRLKEIFEMITQKREYQSYFSHEDFILPIKIIQRMVDDVLMQ